MSFPTSPTFNAVNFKSESPSLYSNTVSGRTQSRKVGGQKWSFTATYPPMTRAEFKPVWAYLVAKQGRHGVFTVVPPIIASTTGTASGTVICTAAVAGSSSVTISGLTGTLEAGDFIKFASHTKVYMLKTNQDGDGAISIEPPLIAAVPSNNQMFYENIAFTVRLANDLQEYQLGVSQLYKIDLDFVEAF
tara:strand:- start:9134 stop:9703 length:570 start_codon:yes stop_codon:yes gene_type:complete